MRGSSKKFIGISILIINTLISLLTMFKAFAQQGKSSDEPVRDGMAWIELDRSEKSSRSWCSGVSKRRGSVVGCCKGGGARVGARGIRIDRVRHLVDKVIGRTRKVTNLS